MIYSFTITKNFLREVSSLEYDQIVKILNFIEENFLYTDGLYLQVDRSILEQKYGDTSNDRIDDFLKTLSRFTKDIFRERNIKADIGLISKGEKNIAVRYSEYEDINFSKFFKNKLNWVWIDTTTTLPINKKNIKILNNFKSCLVCPERWGRKKDIKIYKNKLKKMNFKPTAIMTSKDCLKYWQ